MIINIILIDCAPDAFSCGGAITDPDAKNCYTMNEKCDGVQDCPNGEDENHCSMLTVDVDEPQVIIIYVLLLLHRFLLNVFLYFRYLLCLTLKVTC